MEVLKKWWITWEQIILTLISLVIVASGSYTFGILRGMENAKKPLQITQTQGVNTVLCSEQCQTLGISNKMNQQEDGEVKGTKQTEGGCFFVGSVNGTKYYPPSCKAVGRIKKENLTCFASEDDAKERGYTKTKACD